MKVVFKGNKLEVVFDTYMGTGGTAITLMSDEGEPYATATTNLSGFAALLLTEDPNLVAVKDWSENTGMVEALIESGIIENDLITSFPSGFVSIPVYPLTEQAVKERDIQLTNH